MEKAKLAGRVGADVRESLLASSRLMALVAEELAPAIERAIEMMAETLRSGGTLFFAGNGGSAADAQHLVSELVGRFRGSDLHLPAIALTADSSVMTSLANDYGYSEVFAKQLEALGRRGDLLVLLSTSGNSANLVSAARLAERRGLRTIALLGRGGGKLAPLADCPLLIPSDDVQHIQEAHVAIGHGMCQGVARLLQPPSTLIA